MRVIVRRVLPMPDEAGHAISLGSDVVEVGKEVGDARIIVILQTIDVHLQGAASCRLPSWL